MTLEEWDKKGYKFKRWRTFHNELRPEFTVKNIFSDLDVIVPGTIIRIGKRLYARVL